MSGKAAKVIITEKQQAALQRIAAAVTSSVQHTQRAKIILLAWAGMLNSDIAQQVQLTRLQVGLWRRRWQQSFDALVAIECRETTADLTRMIKQVLSDAPRSGSPGKFAAEQVTQILATACEPPENSDRPIEHWTHRELTDEVIKRGIVSSISKSRVGSFLKDADLQPHRSKYWLNTKEKCQETFNQQVELVCQTYMEAPGLYSQYNTHTVSVDEMPGLQAIERIKKKALSRNEWVDSGIWSREFNLGSGSAEGSPQFHLAITSAPVTGAGRSDGDAEGAQSGVLEK